MLRTNHQYKTYRVREFAKMAGVTVRTLHYYDEAGLLKPFQRTESDHRLYRQEDLLRLQQILTLKHMGFSLQEIQKLLANPSYDVQKSLRIQKKAIEAHIRQLQGVVFALSHTLETLEASEQVNWEQVVAVIKGLSEATTSEWHRHYYTPEQWDWLQARAARLPPEMVDEGARAWETLMEDFRAQMDLPPDHPEVQRLARRMQQLIEAFTGGDTGIERSLSKMYQDNTHVPEAFRPKRERALQEFMCQALTVYREKGTT